MSKLWLPSCGQGYARSSAESANPELWDGLVGAWVPSLGATGDKLQDIARSGNASKVGAGAHWVNTEKGPTLRFVDDDSQYYAHPQPMASEAAVSMVIVLNADTATDYAGNWNASPTGLDRQMFMRDAGQVFIQDAANSANGDASAPNWSYGVWQTLVAVADGANLTVWNGGRAGTPDAIAGPYIPTSSQLWVIGGGHSDGMDGDIAFVAYYNRALTPNEIQQLNVDPLAPFRLKRLVAKPPVAEPPATGAAPRSTLALMGV